MHFKRYLIYFSLALGLASCSETTSTVASGAGFLQININVDPSLTVASTGAVIRLESDMPEVDDFSLRITSADGQYSHEWLSFSDFNPAEPIAPGDYIVEVYSGEEAYNGDSKPYYYASYTATVASTLTTAVTLEAAIANTVIHVDYTSKFAESYPTGEVTLHTSACPYIPMSQSGKPYAFISPGELDLSLTIPYNGEKISITPAPAMVIQAGYFYKITVDETTTEEGVDEIIMSFDEGTDADDIVIPLTEKFLKSPAPTVAPEGFYNDVAYKIAEGNQPSQPVYVTVTSDTPLQRVILTTVAPSLTLNGWPKELNLLSLDAEEKEATEALGLKIINETDESRATLTADFTEVLSKLHIKDAKANDTDSSSYFILRAVDAYGKSSEIVTLKVEVEPVEFQLMSVSSAIAGLDEVEIMIQTSSDAIQDNVSLKILEGERNWTDLPINSLTQIEDNRYTVRFSVPPGNENIKLRVYYCGTLRAEHTIERVSPVFTLTPDAYALKAVLRVNCDDEKLARYITSRLSLFNGSERITVSERDTTLCTLTISGLKEVTDYHLLATLMQSVDNTGWTVPVTFTTESAGALHNGDFEEIEDCISYKNLASGGRYSQSFVEIFNQQNRSTLDLSAPKGWATTNAKTFCEKATNHNTWYLEPSVFTVSDVRSGAYAVKLTSVAWDIDGMAIPDYLQQSAPFKRYSEVVPDIAHRAAGKMYLGSYRFDPLTLEETYNEGTNFTSRPSALNGYYSYRCGNGMPGDRGLARIEMLGTVNGRTVTIARGEALLVPSEGYTAFSIPLDYEMFGVKATRLKIMFASSAHIGDIATESQTIITTPDVVSATSIGSQLWLDDINLSY